MHILVLAVLVAAASVFAGVSAVRRDACGKRRTSRRRNFGFAPKD
jgi:hypothetical protein